MNRTLKRPMFRRGGSAGTGVTSGLDRPGYKDGTPYERALTTTERAMQDLERFRGTQPALAAAGLPGFLTSFGLNLLSATPKGNIFATAAEAAKDPFNTLQKAQMLQRERRGQRAEDLFSTALASEYALEEEKVKAAADTESPQTFEKEQRVKMLNALYDNKITAKEQELQNATPNERGAIQSEIDNLKRLKEDYAISILTGKMTNDEFIKDILVAGIDEGYFDINKVAEAYPELAPLLSDEFRQGQKDGGRTGYQMGGSPMMPDVAKAEQEQVQDLSYNELRSRLPQSIGNDVVQVIANSKQALLDFANIRDQQDVDEFNQRYNVNLNISQEG